MILIVVQLLDKENEAICEICIFSKVKEGTLLQGTLIFWTKKILQILTGTKMTFNDIQGAPLVLPSGNIPYRILIAHHSVLAHKYVRTQGWIGDDVSRVEVKAVALMAHLLDEESQIRVELLWNATPS